MGEEMVDCLSKEVKRQNLEIKDKEKENKAKQALLDETKEMNKKMKTQLEVSAKWKKKQSEEQIAMKKRLEEMRKKIGTHQMEWERLQEEKKKADENIQELKSKL